MTKLASPSTNTARIPETNIDFAAEISSGFAASYIRRKAREISRQTATWLNDPQDLQQELTLQLLQNLASFNPRQGCFNAFVKLVVDRDAANLKRDLSRELAERGEVISLSALVTGADGVTEPLANTVGDDERDAVRGQTSRSRRETFDCQQDVATLIRRLPSRLKLIAKALLRYTPAEVARQTRYSRTTIYELMRRIRVRFVVSELFS